VPVSLYSVYTLCSPSFVVSWSLSWCQWLFTYTKMVRPCAAAAAADSLCLWHHSTKVSRTAELQLSAAKRQVSARKSNKKRWCCRRCYLSYCCCRYSYGTAAVTKTATLKAVAVADEGLVNEGACCLRCAATHPPCCWHTISISPMSPLPPRVVRCARFVCVHARFLPFMVHRNKEMQNALRA